MTATVFRPATPEGRRPTFPVRLSLAPVGSAPLLLDGAWWPRSRDLAAELPGLAAVLEPLWGRITRVTLNPGKWPVIPHQVPVAGHVVKVGWFRFEQDPHELLLFSYRVGRWNLLVVPPGAPAAEAARLMAAASDPHRTVTASGLMAEAAHRTPATEADDATGEAVRESEGGHEAGSAVAPPQDRAVTAGPLDRPERV